MGRRRSRGCSRGTHSSGNGWRRRNCRPSNNVRLICSLLSIISKLHVCLVVDDPLNVWSIDHKVVPWFSININSIQREVLMHGGGELPRIARRRFLVEP
jgi:hypothetical protein